MVFRKKISLTLTVEITLTLPLKNMLYQNTQLNYDTLGMMKLSSTSSQIVEQIRVIQEILLPKASKQIELVMNKQKGDEITFSPEKNTLEKE